MAGEKVDVRVLTPEERDRYEAIRQAAFSEGRSGNEALARLKVNFPLALQLQVMLGGAAVFGLFLALLMWGTSLEDRGLFLGPVIGWGSFLVLPALGIPLVGFARRRTAEWKAGVAAQYLASIGYEERLAARRAQGRGGSEPDYGDNGRTYPVTDGMYDPSLYASRGGRETFQRMQAYGISDYDTFKSNVEEAD